MFHQERRLSHCLAVSLRFHLRQVFLSRTNSALYARRNGCMKRGRHVRFKNANMLSGMVRCDKNSTFTYRFCYVNSRQQKMARAPLSHIWPCRFSRSWKHKTTQKRGRLKIRKIETLKNEKCTLGVLRRVLRRVLHDMSWRSFVPERRKIDEHQLCTRRRSTEESACEQTFNSTCRTKQNGWTSTVHTRRTSNEMAGTFKIWFRNMWNLQVLRVSSSITTIN